MAPKTVKLSPVSPAVAAEELADFWSQKELASANGQLFKVAKGIGETNWHSHNDQDEVFYVLEGKLRILMRDQVVLLNAGDLFVVPRGVEHKPIADELVKFMIIGSTITSTAEGGKPQWS